MKNLLCAALVMAVMATFSSPAIAAESLQPGFIKVQHKEKKQSTGSWKKNREKHENRPKQKKEKKWDQKKKSEGQKEFRPNKFRKK